MSWNEAIYLWLIHSAVVSLLVLAVGSGAVLLCRRPARRAWIIELTLAGCLVAPWLGTIPGYPRLGFGWRAAVAIHREPVLPAYAEGAERMAGPNVVPLIESVPVLPQAASDPAPRTFDASSHTVNIATWIVTAYAMGVVLGLARWLMGLLGLVKIMRTTRPAPSRCRELLAQIAGQRGSRVRLLVSSHVRQPFAFALGRPVIVLPDDLCGDDQAMRWSLAHEWTHIDRHDFRAWLTAGLVRVLFFYHPLVWWLRRQLRLCQDFLADDRAARQTAQPEDYAEFLTAWAATGSLCPVAAGLGMGFSKSELYRRVVMLVQNKSLESRPPRLWTVTVTCAAFVLVSVTAAFSTVPRAAAQGESAAKSAGKPARFDGAPLSPTESHHAQTVAIRGKVIDEDGNPVTGAEVWFPRFIRERNVLRAKSEAQGRFILEIPSAWVRDIQPWNRPNTLWAYAAGHQLGWEEVTLPDGASGVVIRLGPTTDTSFIVLDPEGRPCAGALVEPYCIRTSRGSQRLHEKVMARLGTRTDTEGRVKVQAVPPDLLLEVRIRAKDFGIQVQCTLAENSEPPAIVGRTIRLRPVGRIEGRVIADQPEVVRGVQLILTTAEEYLREPPPWLTEGYADAETDEQGRFVIPAIAAGVLWIEDIVVDESQPLRPKLPQFVRLRPNETNTLGIPMVSTVVVRGSVRVKDTGKAVPGARILVYGDRCHHERPVSDAQGNYAARVPPGSVRVQVISMPKGLAWLHGDELLSPSYQVPEDAKEFDLPPVEVERTKSTPGRVVDQQGKPAGNIWISVVEGDRHYYGRGESDKNGQFEVVGVPVTINPANVKYVWLPEVAPGIPVFSSKPFECEVIKTDPLTLRALPREHRKVLKTDPLPVTPLPRDHRMDQPRFAPAPTK